MVVLIDTNILLNFILKRDPYYKESAQIITWCAEKRLHGYLAFHSLSTIWYVLRKKTDEERRDWLKNICSILSVSSADTDKRQAKTIANELKRNGANIIGVILTKVEDFHSNHYYYYGYGDKKEG